ncbi:response regulator transcription factor [Paraglaciecola chathamensis]|uniref:response regulator transcription factor n=1 Tax=Paraglaciecola chathamensis TaxID=368405 RepID=UPI001375695A|nr:response regulator [Paraglaciecola agarilytica]
MVDDDLSIVNSISNLLSSHGMNIIAFNSSNEFLEHEKDEHVTAHCLLLDIRMPEITGLQLHEILLEKSDPIPVIFITGHGDIRMAVNAIQKGAFEFITKPFQTDELIDVIDRALKQDAKRRQKEAKLEKFIKGFQTLTKREKSLLELILDGKLNKQIAYDLSISEDTVKVHRHNLMKKLEEKSWSKIAVAYEVLKRRKWPYTGS